jgi:hypothetical protein
LWLSSLKSFQNYVRYFSIHKIIDDKGFSLEPFLYQTEDGKIYIIQNVVGGNKLKALAVASSWLTHKINIGSNPEPIPINNIPPHMIYQITASSVIDPIPIEDITDENTEFSRILYYGNPQDRTRDNIRSGRYAAMLELL